MKKYSVGLVMTEPTHTHVLALLPSRELIRFYTDVQCATPLANTPAPFGQQAVDQIVSDVVPY